MVFVEKNYSVFDDEEENKHEYKQIYEDYVAIMEKNIEQKLLESFTEANISQFLTTFKDNMETYEYHNSDTVDILFSFIDFQQFKSQML